MWSLGCGFMASATDVSAAHPGTPGDILVLLSVNRSVHAGQSTRGGGSGAAHGRQKQEDGQRPHHLLGYLFTARDTAVVPDCLMPDCGDS